MKLLERQLKFKGYTKLKISPLTSISEMLSSGLIAIIPFILQIINGEIALQFFVLTVFTSYFTVLVLNVYIYIKRKSKKVFYKGEKIVFVLGLLKKMIIYCNSKDIAFIEVGQTLFLKMVGCVYIAYPVIVKKGKPFKIVCRVKNLKAVKPEYIKLIKQKSSNKTLKKVFKVLLYSLINCDYLSAIILIFPFIRDVVNILGQKVIMALTIDSKLQNDLALLGIPPIISAIGWLMFLFFLLSFIIEVFKNGDILIFSISNKFIIVKKALKTSGYIINKSDIVCKIARRFLLLYPFNIVTYGVGIRNGKKINIEDRVNRNLKNETIFIMTSIFGKIKNNDYNKNTKTYKPSLKGIFSYFKSTIIIILIYCSLYLIAFYFLKDSEFIDFLVALIPLLSVYFLIKILLSIVSFCCSKIKLCGDTISITKREGLSLYTIVLNKNDITKITFSQNIFQKRKNLANVKFYIVGSKKPIAVFKQIAFINHF